MDAKQQACAHSSLILAYYFSPIIKALCVIKNMKIYGYIKDSAQEIPSELTEATLCVNSNELRDLAAFLEECANHDFVVTDIKKTTSKRSPSAPFITSSLQQEVSNKFKYAPKKTMKVPIPIIPPSIRARI